MAACAASGNQQLQVPWLRRFCERTRDANININVISIVIGFVDIINIVGTVGIVGARPLAG
jgi:hypothetical protein